MVKIYHIEGEVVRLGKIKFGTDGWRAIVADTFTFENVRSVSQAIASYVKQIGIGLKGLVVGYDNRFLAERFAEIVSEVLMGNDIPVYFLPGGTPTPVTAFMIKHLQTAGAVMLTASHNPPEYNGIKFIPEYAGPALPEVTDKIEEHLVILQNKSLEEKKDTIKSMPFEKGHTIGLLKKIEPRDSYLKHLESVVDVEGIRNRLLRIVVDPMYGCGIGYLEEFLRSAGCQVKTIHSRRDPLFGGIVPEPMGKWLSELKQAVIDFQADLGLAMDGDADRFGVVDQDGNYLLANQVLYLLLNHLLHTRKYRGPVARTVATTHMLDRMARRYGLAVEETPVGFKYIGQSLLERGALLGGEESGGLSVYGHIPEKDGILAAALMAEVVAVSGKTPGQLMQEVQTEFGYLISERLDIHCTSEEKTKVLEKLQDFNPAFIGEYKVVDRITLDGVKLLLENDNWLLIRPSGTEPLFRLYVEAGNIESMKKIQNEVRNLLGI